VSAWTDEAVSAGARLIGGGRVSSTTLVPAIIVNPPRDAKVSTLEVFGPVTCVYPFTRLDDAITAANSLPMTFPGQHLHRRSANGVRCRRAPRSLGGNGQ
jgi:acyl-CoA reductase-like NAD-dependent aldehyde dehydrogenase